MRIERFLSVVAIVCCLGLLIADHIRHSQMPEPSPVVDDSSVSPSGDALPDEPKVEPKVEPRKETMDGTIVMYTEDWCAPCQRWKSIELPKVLAANWKFETRPAAEGMRIPHFEVYGRGTMIEHTGYMTMGRLKQIVRDLESQR